MSLIISPTDFSETALNANIYAARIAKEIDAKLMLLHVMHVPAIDVNSAANVLDTLMETQRIASRNKLEAACETILETTGLEATFDSDFGLAVDVIGNTAEKLGANMIIMGTNGASNMIDELLGTVSYGVVKRSAVPVLVVPNGSEFKGLNHIAFANDHQENISTQLDFIYNITEQGSTKIDIISVEAGREHNQYEEECVCDEGGVKEVCVWSDEVENGIEEYVKRHQIEVLAVKRHHRTFFENLFHHSTTKEVLNKSAIPVLIFN